MAEEEERPRGEGFLAGWSRRKRAAAQAESEAAQEILVEEGIAPVADDPVDAEPEITEEELAALPKLEEITGETDLRPFQKRGVPEALRKAAMRKVWLSSSLIRDHDDPAVDYAWDWNSPEGVPGAGGVIGQDKVSKMLDDLVNKDTAKDAPATEAGVGSGASEAGDVEETERAAPVEGDGAEASDSPAEPALASEAHRLSEPGQAADKPAVETGEAGAPQEENGDGVLPPRRHGSAIPG